ncbi:MAG: hypothetical protein K6A41_09560 [Bacteroidales bacterium]|nr:hypothetical protein [Bacteroidales bacterium]
MNKKLYLFLFAFTTLLCGCKPSAPEAPKPMGYLRIDLPERNYDKVDTTLPFTFEQSDKSQLSIKPQKDGNCWVDIDYPDLNATLKLTCLKITSPDSLRDLIYSEEKMVKFHYQKADDVEYSVVKDEDSHLWGQIYDIKGKEVATPFQFWLTDSTRNFVRATLYFNFTPNNDSLQPVIDYLREDAMHYINTFEWK